MYTEQPGHIRVVVICTAALKEKLSRCPSTIEWACTIWCSPSMDYCSLWDNPSKHWAFQVVSLILLKLSLTQSHYGEKIIPSYPSYGDFLLFWAYSFGQQVRQVMVRGAPIRRSCFLGDKSETVNKNKRLVYHQYVIFSWENSLLHTALGTC